MPKNSISYVKDILEGLRIQGITEESKIPRALIAKMIMIKVGRHPKLLEEYLRYMGAIDVLHPAENGTFTIDFERAAELSL
jgi:hypothetical protein